MMRHRTRARGRSAVLAILAGCAVSVEVADRVPVKKSRPPSVLFVIADDLAAALGPYGHPRCVTPRLDELAGRGVRFDRAYCQFPLCGPSRASMMTSLYPAVSGVRTNQDFFRDQVPGAETLAQVFTRAGYAVARVGKIFHMGVPGDVARGTPGVDDPASWPETFDMQGLETETPGIRAELSPALTHYGSSFLRIIAAGDDLDQPDGRATTTAIRWLESHADEPFFLAVGYVRPHVPLIAPAPYFEPYPDAEMVLPTGPADDLADLPEAALGQTNERRYRMTPAQGRGALAGYYASIAFVDAQFGRLLDTLERLGLAENTIVVFASDHGYHLGQHTMWQKLSLMEDVARIPLIVATPGGRSGSTEGLVELVDLGPTLAELCGLEHATPIQGRSFASLLKTPERAELGRTEAYTQMKRGDAIRTARYRLIAWSSEAGEAYELYDHATDPDEFDNLARDPHQAELLERLVERLERVRAATGVRARRD